MEAVTLRDVRGEGGWRHLSARLTDEGDLLIEGQDLGPGVEECFGPGLTEYEWVHTVHAEHIPLLVAALGGEPGEPVLPLLARTCSGAEAIRLSRLLGPDGPVPATFWSRVGD